MIWADLHDGDVEATFQINTRLIRTLSVGTISDAIRNTTPVGCYKIHSIYLDADLKIVVKYEDTPES